MTRFVTTLALALSLVTSSLVAFAGETDRPVAARQEQAKKGDKKDKNDKKFPMKADEYKKLVQERIAKVRGRMEKHIEKKNVPADKAKEIRAKFDAGVARVNQLVEKVTADGTVTKEEAKQVHDLVQELTKDVPHKKHAKGKKGDKK